VRTWRHFLQHNGFLLAAGISYQGLFAFFAALYVAFAGVGLWLGGSPDAVLRLVAALNGYIPHLIAVDDERGLLSLEQVQEIVGASSGVLAATGVVALVAAVWTAIGFVTFARRAVRDIYGLPYDNRSYLLLKARDLVASIVFGVALIIGSALITLGTYSLTAVFTVLDWNTDSAPFTWSVRVASVVVSLLISTAAVAGLFWFLTGTSRRWRTIWPGSLVGGIGITVLQLAAGLLLVYTPTNPLLATFAIFVGLMLWFRLMGVVLLVAAAWIAVTARDEDFPLLEKTEAERLSDEHQALLLAAQVRLRTAEEALAEAPWYRVWRTQREVRQAAAELEQVMAAASPPPRRRASLLD
jgi:membrane protein